MPTVPKIDFDSYVDHEFPNNFDTRRERRDRQRYKKGRPPRGREERVQFLADLVEHAEKIPVDVQQHFAPTFSSSGHEQFWILNYLEDFYLAQVITDVLGKVKGGKEANVYCCAAHPSTGLRWIAAKIYRPRMFRNLRNDARYRQGREALGKDGKAASGRRETLAIHKNTRFGQELRHSTWLETEYQTLQRLYEAGADVPRPLGRGSNVILMEYVGQADGGAPTLNQVRLERREAQATFARVVDNLALMLANHCIHADLSAYNILYWEGQFKIIDFPQAVDPRRNPEAGALFDRDVQRVCQYFARYGIREDPLALADTLWSRFQQANALDAGIVMEEEEA
jgi:RIO kinase 1